MTLVYIAAGGFALFVILLVVGGSKAGPRSVDEDRLATARPVLRLTRDAPGHGWQVLGSHTEARGLDLRFTDDDDPRAQAWLLLGDRTKAPGTYIANRQDATLTDEFTAHHVHAAGYVFRASLRAGEPAVLGRTVVLEMAMGGKGKAVGASIENDDDRDPAMDGWIEVESLEILKLREA